MYDMFMNSMRLFLTGRLFQDLRMVLIRSAIGSLITACICIAGYLTGLPLAFAVILAALAGGALQPWLYKDLRYR